MINDGVGTSGGHYTRYESSLDEYTGLFTSFSSTLINTSKIQCGTQLEFMTLQEGYFQCISAQLGIFLGVKL